MSFKERVLYDWIVRTFGGRRANDPHEQALRLLEEATEVAQAAGVDRDLVTRITDHVYSKMPGTLATEVAQARLCTLAVSATLGLNGDVIEDAEIARVLSIPTKDLRERYRLKCRASITSSSDESFP